MTRHGPITARLLQKHGAARVADDPLSVPTIPSHPPGPLRRAIFGIGVYLL
jgi:hypothetical protein